MFTDIDAAIEEAMYRMTSGDQIRHYGLVQKGNLIAVRIVRNRNPQRFMWTTKSCVSH